MSSSTVPDGHPPVIGHYRILRPVPSPTLRNWLEVIDTTRSIPVWLHPISEARLKSVEIDRHPPSLKLARQHASLIHVGLQSFSPPEYLDGYLAIAGTPAFGQPLRDLIQSHSNRRLPSKVATLLVQKISAALAVIHRAGLVHGNISMDQVWWNGKDEVTLLRDPFYAPMSPLEPIVASSIGTSDDRDSRTRYAAPEFTIPGLLPTQATDIYAIGCLWWELLTGNAPFAELPVSNVPDAACRVALSLPNEIELSIGHRKCLEHLLAKNPNNRFANCDQIIKALEAIGEVNAAPASAAPIVAAPPVHRAVNPVTQAPLPSPPKRDEAKPVRTKQVSIDAAPGGMNPPIVPPSIASAPTSKAPVKPTAPEPPVPPPTVAKANTVRPLETTLPQAIVPAQESNQTKANQVESSKPVPIVATDSQLPTKIEPPPEMAPVPPIANAETATPVVAFPAKAPAALLAGNKPKKNSASPAGRRSSKKGRPAWLIPAMIGGCIAVLGGLAGILTWTGSGSSSKPNVAAQPKASSTISSVGQNDSTPADSSTSPAPGTRARVVDPLEDQYLIAKGDSSIPWVPPRASQPYSLAMLPPGAQGFIFVRPNAWLSTLSGKTIVDALASAIESIWQPFAKSVAIAPENMRELAIGLYGGRSDGWPLLVYRAELEVPTTLADLQAKFQGSSEQTLANQQSMLVAGEQAIYLSPTSEVSETNKQAVTFGPVALIRELSEMEGGAPLRRQMEQLWQVSDAQSDLTLLLSTGFFFSDARNILPSISPRFQSLCKEMFDEKTQAILFSTSIEPQWYGELRAIGQSNDDAARFTTDLQSRMKGAADFMESELVASPATPYWRAIAARFPQMLRALVRYQRFGVENGQAISNFYLPSIASANVAIASWMSLQTATSAPGNAISSVKAPSVAKLTGDALLGHLVSINFEQEPLDSALALITEEVNRSLPPESGPIELSIDGKSFELASVTRNQQIREFRFKDKPLRDLLTDLAARVNPDRTVKSLDEEKQAVVWVLSEETGKGKIIFTTRRGIEGTDRKLPKEFTKAVP